MTELILLTIILTAILRTIRKLRPGALPRLANLACAPPCATGSSGLRVC